ncbi:MAG: uracil-DNA glycosylase [Nitrosopumilaceae archaeon]|nr:uracil-DNA glycosylase [Nitrosopumilaceae archaeon]
MDKNTISDQVIFCKKCNLHKCRINAVPGAGNINSNVMLIGEAPGTCEDKSGTPFVGRAGKILSNVLNYNGINRSSIYITNIVKCKPPHNRLPTKNEIDECKKYLMLEIDLINPKIICIMGNTAYNAILGGKQITKNRGKLIKHRHQYYFLTIHPAATIYNAKLFDVLKSDIKQVFYLSSQILS